MDYLLAHSRQQPALVPLGLLTTPRADEALDLDVSVRLNPNGAPSAEPARCRGFVALAANFAVVRDFAEELREPAPPAPSEPPRPEPVGDDGAPHADRDAPPTEPQVLVRAITPPLRRVVICGFRSATVSLIEALVIAEPEAEILVLVDTEEARLAALDDFDARTNLVANGLLSPRHGVFTVDEDGALHGRRHRDPNTALGRIRIAVGDYTSSRRLVSLPCDFGHAAEADVVVFLSKDHATDARIAKALMKLEALISHDERRAEAAGREHSRPRITAELFDSELARRLRKHFAYSAPDEVRILSTQALRALFLYQSVIVPSFDEVYAELLGPWGQSLLRMVPGELGEVTSYRQLADALARQHAILLALELRTADGSIDLQVGTSIGDQPLASERIVCAWVIATDEPPPTTHAGASPERDFMGLA
jgi:hypothetical protein